MKNILFKIAFIFFTLFTLPLFWFSQIPGIPLISKYYNKMLSWIVGFFNSNFLHVKEELNMMGYGSGDTTYSWAEFFTHIILAVIGSFIWTLIDRNRKSYKTLHYWLNNFIRYYVSLIAFLYGIIKLFTLQMPFPNLSQLATPLGDFLPMRFSWMFIGYSTSYQIFSGIAEILVGILLLNRKTVNFGSLLGVGVFANVFILNMSYDIPVKIFSFELLMCCVYLVLMDWNRVLNFFILNKSVSSSKLFEPIYTKKWQKIMRWIFKGAFILFFVLKPLKTSWNRYQGIKNPKEEGPIKQGVYEVKSFIKNNDTLAIPLVKDQEWKDFIFDKNGSGSINTLDTLFNQRYRRGYFLFEPDTASNNIEFRKSWRDTTPIFTLNYTLLNDRDIQLYGKVNTDSISISLFRTDRHFQLTERQFHWVSESNR